MRSHGYHLMGIAYRRASHPVSPTDIDHAVNHLYNHFTRTERIITMTEVNAVMADFSLIVWELERTYAGSSPYCMLADLAAPNFLSVNFFSTQCDFNQIGEGD